MKLNNLVVIKAMTDNTMISVYNIPFYKSKKMYENRLLNEIKVLKNG